MVCMHMYVCICNTTVVLKAGQNIYFTLPTALVHDFYEK